MGDRSEPKFCVVCGREATGRRGERHAGSSEFADRAYCGPEHMRKDLMPGHRYLVPAHQRAIRRDASSVARKAVRASDRYELSGTVMFLLGDDGVAYMLNDSGVIDPRAKREGVGLSVAALCELAGLNQAAGTIIDISTHCRCDDEDASSFVDSRRDTDSDRPLFTHSELNRIRDALDSTSLISAEECICAPVDGSDSRGCRKCKKTRLDDAVHIASSEIGSAIVNCDVASAVEAVFVGGILDKAKAKYNEYRSKHAGGSDAASVQSSKQEFDRKAMYSHYSNAKTYIDDVRKRVADILVPVSKLTDKVVKEITPPTGSSIDIGGTPYVDKLIVATTRFDAAIREYHAKLSEIQREIIGRRDNTTALPHTSVLDDLDRSLV